MLGFDGTPYAVFQDSGRQFRVSEGDEVLLDCKRGVKTGDSLVFDQVLMLRDQAGVWYGKPCVQGAKVEAEVLGEEKGEKLVVLKFRRRKDSRVKTGHRARFTRVRVTGIRS